MTHFTNDPKVIKIFDELWVVIDRYPEEGEPFCIQALEAVINLLGNMIHQRHQFCSSTDCAAKEIQHVADTLKVGIEFHSQFPNPSGEIN